MAMSFPYSPNPSPLMREEVVEVNSSILALRKAVTNALFAAQKGDIPVCRAARLACEAAEQYAARCTEEQVAPLRDEIDALNAEADRQDRLIRSLMPAPKKANMFDRLFSRGRAIGPDTVRFGA